MQSVLRRSSVSILRARSAVLPTLINNSRPVLSSSSSLRSAFSTSIIRSKDQEANHRYTSGAWKEGKNVSYEELKPITMSPDDKVLIIGEPTAYKVNCRRLTNPEHPSSWSSLPLDVREPDEVALGSIPSSVNLPLSSFEKSLSMDEGDFTRINGFHKPEKGQNIIFYCRSGKRAVTAIDLAKRAGYRSMRNYEGSYLDWQAKDSKADD